jgi:aspartate-semialdehyde dehydrogenase
MNRSSYRLKEKVVIIYDSVNSKDTCRKNTKKKE